MKVERHEGGDAITDLLLTTFRLNGAFLAAADRLSAPVGITAARWQVLGSIMGEDKTVAQIARDMGVSRQGIQRLANVLADEGLVVFIENPEHKRSKLIRASETGRAAMYSLSEVQHIWANSVAEGLDAKDIRDCVALMRKVVARLEI